MYVNLSEDHTELIITNVSIKEGRVHHEKLLTFKRGGKFTLYMERGGVANFIGTYSLASDMPMTETRRINIGNIIKSKGIQTGAKITVV